MRAKKDKKLLPDAKPVDKEEDEGDGNEGDGDDIGWDEDGPELEVLLAPASKKRKAPEPGQLTFSFDVSLHSLLQKLTSSRARKRQRKTSKLRRNSLRMRSGR